MTQFDRKLTALGKTSPDPPRMKEEWCSLASIQSSTMYGAILIFW